MGIYGELNQRWEKHKSVILAMIIFGAIFSASLWMFRLALVLAEVNSTGQYTIVRDWFIPFEIVTILYSLFVLAIFGGAVAVDLVDWWKDQ